MTRFVGIVLVSHSAELAAGLRELLLQVGGASLTIETAGGTDDGRIGTSYDLVRAAIEKADAGAGVLVLPDLGSSVLTARAVLDDHPHLGAGDRRPPEADSERSERSQQSLGAGDRRPEERSGEGGESRPPEADSERSERSQQSPGVAIVDAPFVEGAMAAAVIAATGADLAAAVAAAEEARDVRKL